MKFRYFIFLILITGFCFGHAEKEQQLKNPKIAFYFSLVPGLGQVYNGKWLKSALLIGLEIAAYDAWTRNKDIYNNWDPETSPKEYELPKYRYLAKRNKYAWWIGFIYVYGMIDAVVDAHLHKFDQVMDSSLDNENKENIKYAE
tara:strand:- start:18241 stop:18672 length:432 start_codon:yes stop_codon:yes gene_type:complete